MRARELLRRLDRLRLPGEEEPRMLRDLAVLSRVEKARFWELYHSLRDEDATLTENETMELWSLWCRCPPVESGKGGNPHAETGEERRERQALERAFGGAFHDYARQYPFIAVPNYANGLNEYRLDIGYRLFEKYGWVPGERDCATILPLDRWEAGDREALIDLYRRSNPECSSDAPPGWTSKFGRRTRF